MKIKVVLLLVFVSILTLVISSYKEGPDWFGLYECTGATGLYHGCSGSNNGITCHSNTTTLNNVVVELDSAGTRVKTYHPGHTYTVKLSGTNGTGQNLPYFGFQLTSVLLAGYGDTTTVRQGGTWDSTSLPAHVRYQGIGDYALQNNSGYRMAILEQKDSGILATTGTGANGTTYVESFTWHAPAAGTGTILLLGELNAVNHDLTVTNASTPTDFSQHAADTITEGGPAGINSLADNVSGFSVYPTLAIDNITLAFDLREASAVRVTMISMQGQEVKVLLAPEPLGAGPFKRTFDVNGLATGIYLVRLQIGNESLVSKVIKE
jgi:hypothetical protein